MWNSLGLKIKNLVSDVQRNYVPLRNDFISKEIGSLECLES
jgi:hypothetical protein